MFFHIIKVAEKVFKKAVDLKGGSAGLVKSKLLVDHPSLGSQEAWRNAFLGLNLLSN